MSYADALANAREKGRTKRLTSVPFKWEEGKSLVGRYLGLEVIKSSKKDMPDFNQYKWDTDDGPVTCIMSGAFDAKVDQLLDEGGIYSVTYKGKIQISKGHTFKVFDVELVSDGEDAGGGKGK